MVTIIITEANVLNKSACWKSFPNWITLNSSKIVTIKGFANIVHEALYCNIMYNYVYSEHCWASFVLSMQSIKCSSMKNLNPTFSQQTIYICNGINSKKVE